jgi:hypothetical protein
MSKGNPVASLFMRAGMTCLSALLLLATASAQNYSITGNTPGFIKKAQDLGALDPTTVISVTTWLKLHNEKQLDNLAQSVNQKGSSNYHKWLTQAQFEASFSPKANEVNAVQNFLQAHGLTLLAVAGIRRSSTGTTAFWKPRRCRELMSTSRPGTSGTTLRKLDSRPWASPVVRHLPPRSAAPA